MSTVVKGLNRSDVYLTDYNSRKKWRTSGDKLDELGIKLMIAVTSSRPYYFSEDDEKTYSVASGSTFYSSSDSCSTYNSKLLYGRVFESYYSGSLGDGTFSGSKDLSLQTTLTLTESRAMTTRVYRDARDSEDLPDHQKNYNPRGFVVISIPTSVFGTHISEGSLGIDLDEDVMNYVEDDYMIHETGSFCDEGYPLGTWTRESDHWVDPYFEDLHSSKVFDFEGLLLYSGFSGEWHQPDEYKYPTPRHESNAKVGDVVYGQGQIIITDEYLQYLLSTWDMQSIQWESNKPIFTQHVTCHVRDVDFNKTFNPTAPEELQATPGFTPYVTTVGLYNNSGILIAVAKLSKPIKKPLDTEMTFDIQIDLG